MAAIEVKELHVAYGDKAVLHGVDLVVEDAAVTAVLGPSGCGKTSLLRVVAGLLRPTAGRVSLGGAVVVDDGIWVRPERRRIGIVPQEGALFPHLDVAGNVGFGLPGSRREKSVRVAELLALVGMAGTGSMRPQELSGGMQQRVAVARALSRRPDVVLLDEPFSALDAGLRDEVRADVLAAIRADGAAALLVTHDQDEALSSADRVAVMRDGVVVQEGAPSDVYGSPVDLGVARFVGECVELPLLADADGSLRTALGAAAGPGGSTGVAVLRPEELVLSEPGSGADGAPVRIVSVRYHGHDCLLDVVLPDGHVVAVRTLGSTPWRPGDDARLTARVPARVLA
ncbi:MAG: ABC transporter ATP-binding protein [Actinobacteria bacterium]|nr:ABC transporter ATP-binding protein [Actinomycetota bacterium]